MMNISPIVNSVKCTVFSRFVQFSHGLEGSTAGGIPGFLAFLAFLALLLCLKTKNDDDEINISLV